MIDKEKLAAALHKCSVNGEMRYFAPSNVMEEVDGELFNTLEYAARTLQAILPMLEEMVEARKTADQSGLWRKHARPNGTVYVRNDGGILAEGPKPMRYDGQDARYKEELSQYEGNADFMISAANNTAEIGKILGGQAQCSLMK